MLKRTLLLTNNYEALSFISERKAIKFLFKDNKVEVISIWEDIIKCGNIKINHPSILRLVNPIKRNIYKSAFSRKALIKRDNSSCQYCALKLPASKITIDHVIPKSRGGITSFTNCVISCLPCNNRKADFNLDQINMALINKPIHPSFISLYNDDVEKSWHQDWSDYVKKVL